MADDEHVAILKRGVDAWNEWRRENPDIVPDLRRNYPHSRLRRLARGINYATAGVHRGLGSAATRPTAPRGSKANRSN
jgi:hypothetical protein